MSYSHPSFFRQHQRFLLTSVISTIIYQVNDNCWPCDDAESFFSRLRRAEVGIHHHIAGRHLSAYAAEMAWREDRRRTSNGDQFLSVTNAALNSPMSRTWRGYWHRKAA